MSNKILSLYGLIAFNERNLSYSSFIQLLPPLLSKIEHIFFSSLTASLGQYLYPTIFIKGISKISSPTKATSFIDTLYVSKILSINSVLHLPREL